MLLADEPIASLDPRNTQLVMDALQRLNRHFGITVICNLHALDVARAYCDRLVGMAAGEVVFDGPPAALTDDAACDALRLAGQAGGVPRKLAGRRLAEARFRAVADAARCPVTQRGR